MNKYYVFCLIVFTKLCRIRCVHHNATTKNPLKVEYEIIPKRQRLTEDVGISEKLVNNISFHESFNQFITLYSLKEYVDDANANGYHTVVRAMPNAHDDRVRQGWAARKLIEDQVLEH